MRKIALFTGCLALALAGVACSDEPDPVPTGDGGVGNQDANAVADTGVRQDTGVRPDAGPGQDAQVGGDTGVVDQDGGGGGGDAAVQGDGGDHGDGAVGGDGGNQPNQVITMSGKVVSLATYLAGAQTYVGDVSVGTYGVDPADSDFSSSASGTLGDFTLDVPQNGQIIVFTLKAGYFFTYTAVTTGTAAETGKNVFVADNTYINNVAATHGIANLAATFACHAPNVGQNCIYDIILGRIYDDGTQGNGQFRPVGGIDANDFTVTGPAGEQNWYKQGPYFLNTDGTPNAANGSSQANGAAGGLFVLFVEHPQTAGDVSEDFSISIEYVDNNQGGLTRYFGPAQVKTFRPNGVSWATIYETGNVPPMPGNNVDFDSQIYPLFLTVGQGGLGCQGCHTSENGATPSGALDLSGGPANAYTDLDPNNNSARVNTANPAASLLLTKPLFEASGAQNHPIFAFASTNDPAYQLVLQWITEGGLRNNGGQAVSFLNDVRPLLYYGAGNGGAGCAACHVTGVNANNAPGGAYFGGNVTDLYNVLVNQTATDNGGTGEQYRINKNGQPENSLLLTNPLYGNTEPHPVKVFSGATDSRYQTIYQWIQEGYQNN